MEYFSKIKTKGDGVAFTRKKSDFFDFEDFSRRRKENLSTLFSRGKRTTDFVTSDSGLYFSVQQKELLEKAGIFGRGALAVDSVCRRAFLENEKVSTSPFFEKMFDSYRKRRDALVESIEESSIWLTPRRAWNMSIVGALIMGMVSMSFIYRYLGPSAEAGSKKAGKVATEQIIEEEDEVIEIDAKMVRDLLPVEADEEKSEFEEELGEMVKGYPIEKMIPEIVKQDRIVAAFLVSIAKKESNWGRRVPVLNGQDCYNYWGYRGKREKMGTGGHTCFDSRKDAIETVGERIDWLVKNAKRDTPSEMIVWKCGSTCEGHSKQSVNKWISDVALYFDKLNK